MLTERALTCPYCNGNTVLFCKGTDRLLHIAKESVTYYRCTECRATLQHPLPSPEETAALYADTTYTPYAAAEVRKREWPLLGTLPTSGRIIDIGCGGGKTLASFFKGNPGWTGIGLDFSPQALENAKSILPPGTELQHGDILELLQKLPSASFDLIVCEQVIEHLRSPEELLRQIARILKPAGKAFLSYPNGGSILMSVAKSFAYHLDAPRHFYIPSHKSIRSLSQRVGLRVSAWEGQRYPSCFWRSIAYLLHKPSGALLSPSVLRIHALLLKPWIHTIPSLYSKIECVLVKSE